MKKVLINVSFKDRYTGKMHTAGSTTEMTEERIKEVKEINPNFVTVIGTIEEKKQADDEKADDEKADDKKADKNTK